jgi:hypothetical protein
VSLLEIRNRSRSSHARLTLVGREPAPVTNTWTLPLTSESPAVHEISDTERAENDPSSEANQFGSITQKEAQYLEYEALAKTDPHPGAREEHREGTVARSIEQQTAKLPSDWFLWAAFGSIAGSLAFKLSGKDHEALFVGQWAPTFLILGLYNKLVKLHGSEGV